MNIKLEKIIINKEVKNNPVVNKILLKIRSRKRCSGVFQTRPNQEICEAKKIEIEEAGLSEVIKEIKEKQDPIGCGKKILYLTENTGQKIVGCPGTKYHICCGYQIISPLSGCPLDCCYCILQVYYKNKPLIFDVGVNKIVERLKFLLNTTEYTRWGTGEFSDSLSLENILGFHKDIIKTILNVKDRFIELKTKDRFDIESIPCDKRVIIGFSVNVNEIIKNEEQGTISLTERLELAKRCENAGFSLSFHFDPIIDRDDLVNEYVNLIKNITQDFNYKRVAYLSLGTLRFSPKLPAIIRERFPESRILEAQFVRGIDKKWRYKVERRICIYKKMIENITKEWKDKVYLCMESDEVTNGVFGCVYNLRERLDSCVKRVE
ncbi:MAG: spore photoproduct lyase family protein [Candidatus Hydrogenedentota bacterium]